MTARDPDPHGDAAAFALGALDGDESARFRRHADECPECRAELRELGATVELLALGAPRVEVPRSLRRRVLADVRADARARARGPGRARRAAAVTARNRRPALPIGAGALALAAVAAAVVIALSGGGSRVYRARVAFRAASASVRVDSGRAQLVVSRLPAPPPGKVYEVWVARGTTAAPAGARFGVDATGAATVRLRRSLRGASAVMVTVEPAGGSRAPTGKRVIVARLS